MIEQSIWINLLTTAKATVNGKFPHYDGNQIRDLWFGPRDEFDGLAPIDLYLGTEEDLQRLIAWAEALQ